MSRRSPLALTDAHRRKLEARRDTSIGYQRQIVHALLALAETDRTMISIVADPGVGVSQPTLRSWRRKFESDPDEVLHQLGCPPDKRRVGSVPQTVSGTLSDALVASVLSTDQGHWTDIPKLLSAADELHSRWREQTMTRWNNSYREVSPGADLSLATEFRSAFGLNIRSARRHPQDGTEHLSTSEADGLRLAAVHQSKQYAGLSAPSNARASRRAK